MNTPTTTARRKKPLRATKDKTPVKPVSDVDAVEVVPEASTDDGAHLTNFIVPDIDDETQDVDAPVNVAEVAQAQAVALAEAPPELIGQDAFFTVFKIAFDVPQFLQPDLAALVVQPEEEPAARAASDATYGLLKIYYPAALTPKGEVFGHLMIAGPFLIGKVMLVREVIRARRAKPVNGPDRPNPPEPPTPQAADGMTAANDNWPNGMTAVDIAP